MSKEYIQSRQLRGCYIVSASNCGSDNVPRSRIRGMVSGSQGVLKAGTILGFDSSNNEYVALDPAGSNGAEIATAILYDSVDTGDGDAVHAPIDTGEMAVHGSRLILPSGMDAADLMAVFDQLKASGFVVRNSEDLSSI